MAIYNKQVEFSRKQLINHHMKKDLLFDYIYGIVRLLGIIVQNIYCVSSYLVLSWILLLPVGWLRADLYSRIENYLYNSLIFIVSSWSLAAGDIVVETGDDFKPLIENDNNIVRIPNGNIEQNGGDYATSKSVTDSRRNKANTTAADTSDIKTILDRPLDPNIVQPRILLLCNHISTADVPLMMQAFSTMTKQSILWVLDAQFKLTNFGLVCGSHGDFFISKDTFTNGCLKDQVLRHPDRNILVLFPEGGFLRKRLEGSNRYALKNNLGMTRYVTYPRFGAFKDLIDESVGVTHIVDATLLYDDIKNPLSILDIAFGNRVEPAVLHYKVYNIAEINPTEEWLRNLWLEKEKFISQYYEDRDSLHRKFDNNLRSAKLDWIKLFSVHLFYLLACYLTIYRLFSATSVTMLKAKDLYYSNI